MSKLTTKELEALTAEEAGKRLRDGGNLIGTVRATSKGISVLFRWRYRFEGKTKDFTCGTWPTDSLRSIRENRAKAALIVANGKDPGQDKVIARIEKKAEQVENLAKQHVKLAEAEALCARLTVNDLFDQWSSIELKNRKDGGAELRRAFSKDVLPKIGKLAAEDVKKAHIMAVIDALLARGVPRMAKRTLADMRQMFRFAEQRDIVQHDPTAKIEKKRIGGQDVERDRVLSEAEIRELRDKLPDGRFLHSTELALWIQLSTCCRIGEILSAEWKNINLDEGAWKIPEENSKNGKAHVVYLSDFAIDKFKRLQEISGTSTWCYPDRTGTKAVCPKTITVQIRDRQRGKALSNRSGTPEALKLSGGEWTPHDLRRTGATMMARLGVLPAVVEKCLNHTEQNRVLRTYQQYGYEKEMREAWHLLGDRLEILLRNTSQLTDL